MDKEKNEGKITKEEFAENKNVLLQTIILDLVKELFSLGSYSDAFTMICPSRVGLKDYNYQCIRVEDCLACWQQAIEQGVES